MTGIFMRHASFVQLLRSAFLVVLIASQFFVASLSAHARENGPLLVFAASSLKNVLEAIAVDFEKETGQKVVFSFAASSTLARQIAAGAPADIYIAADADWAAWVQRKNLTVIETKRLFARNRLVLVAPQGRSVDPAASLVELLRDFRDNHTGRLAVADPDNVPAGRYARSALRALANDIGPYKAFEKRFAIGGSVRLASLFVARGEALLGIVYQSDAVAEPRIKIVGLFSPESHAEIVYPAMRLVKGKAEADRFLTYLHHEKARHYLEAFGLIAPEEGQ